MSDLWGCSAFLWVSSSDAIPLFSRINYFASMCGTVFAVVKETALLVSDFYLDNLPVENRMRIPLFVDVQEERTAVLFILLKYQLAELASLCGLHLSPETIRTLYIRAA